jgi:hypothetical protein
MPEATDEVLTKLVEDGPFQSYRIEGPQDTHDARYLGVVGVANSHATFHVSDHFSFAGKLSPDSRFEIRNLRRPGHPSFVFVVFRQFDSSRFQASPEDIIAGWVPEDEAEQARDWVNEMNNRIRAYPLAFSTFAGETERVNTYFAIRTRFPGTLATAVEEVERVLGCTFHPATGRGWDGQPAFEAKWDGLRISLVESPAEGDRPRHIRMAGNPDRDDLPVYTSAVDLSPKMLDRLVLTSAEWYVASAEELRVEKDGYS